MSSAARDIQITSVGLTPNPVNTEATSLVQIGVAEIIYTWGDWASNRWTELGAMMWGSP